MDGKIVMQRKAISGVSPITLSTIRIAAGSYMLKVESGSERYCQTFIITK